MSILRNYFKRIIIAQVTSSIIIICSSLITMSFASGLPTIKVTCNPWIGFAPIIYAEKSGYYTAHHLNVVLTFSNSKASSMEELERGLADVDMMTVDDYQRAKWIKDRNGVIIGTTDVSLGGDGVVAAGNIKSVKDLKGKIIATGANIPATMLLDLELKKAGVPLKDVDKRYISGDEALSVFADEKVSAVGTYQPYISEILNKEKFRNPHLLISSKSFPGYVVDVVVVRKSLIVHDKKELTTFLNGIYQGISAYKDDPSHFVSVVAPSYNLNPQKMLNDIKISLVYTNKSMDRDYFGTKGQLFAAYKKIAALNTSIDPTLKPIPNKEAIDTSIILPILEKK